MSEIQQPPHPYLLKAPERSVTPIAEIESRKVPEVFEAMLTNQASRHDKIVGIPVKDDEIDRSVTKNLDSALRNNSSFACIVGDLDQLKQLNNISRSTGDVAIKWGALSLLEGVDKAQLPSEYIVAQNGREIRKPVNIIFARDSHAADETVVWIFGLNESDNNKLKQAITGLSEEVVSLADGKEVTFSSSYGIVTSYDDNQNLRKSIEETKQFLEQDEKNQPRNLHRDLEQMANDFSKEEKISKELERIPIEQLFEPNHIDEFISLITSDFGGGRVSAHVLELLLKLQSIKAVTAVVPELYQTFLTRIGVSPEDIASRIRNASTPHEKIEQMVEIFQGLFGKSGA